MKTYLVYGFKTRFVDTMVIPMFLGLALIVALTFNPVDSRLGVGHFRGSLSLEDVSTKGTRGPVNRDLSR